MKFLFVARAIGGMAGALAERGHAVELFTWDLAGAEAFYPIDPRIRWHRLNLGDPQIRSGAMLKLRRGVAIRKLVRQVRPDAIVCFQEGPSRGCRAQCADPFPAHHRRAARAPRL
jgi:hypothetical protein